MRILATILCALVLGAATPSWAQVTRDQAAAVAQRLNGGRVLAVDRTDADGRTVWRVKVLTPTGEVRVVLIDMASGKPL
jgi:uncharacterized membrane protein YkoI